MAQNSKFTPERVGIIKSIINHLQLVSRLMRDSRVPALLKVLPLAPLLYLIMPLDVIPDMIPVLGQMDDLGVILLGMEAFIRFAPQSVVQQHREDINSQLPFSDGTSKSGKTTIDGQWTVVDKDAQP